MQEIFKVSALMLAAMLAACGGGGGNAGDTQGSYSITLRADKTQLPLNLAGAPAGQGLYAPYSTALYVQASEDGKPIPGGEGVFECNMSGGRDSGWLYRFDGDEVPKASSSLRLGSIAGGSSFHFHAGHTAGTVSITCSVTGPLDKHRKSTSVDITVGAAPGKAASIQVTAEYPLLGRQENMNNLRTSTAIAAHVLDDANQPVPASPKANLQVTHRP